MTYPLTFQQQALWRHVRQHPDWKCAVPHAFCLKGPLHVVVFRHSLEEVIRRHSSLRSSIVLVAGTPYIEADTSSDVDFEVVRIEGHSRAQREVQAGMLFRALADKVVDPTIGPLLTVRLLEFDEHEHWVLVELHRLLADCFSAEQVLTEIWEIYADFSQGRPSSLSADPMQYSEYALWQQVHGQEWLCRHEEYWNKRLAGAMSVHWPADVFAVDSEYGGEPTACALARPAPLAQKDGLTGRMSIQFGQPLSAQLQEFARRTRSLSAMVMLSVYVAVLWKWCGQLDFVLPFYVAGRPSEHKVTVGYFSHVLYLRIELVAAETFSQLVSRVSNEFFRALAHQDFGRQATERPQLLAGVFCQWVTWHTDVSVKASGERPLGLRVERLPLGEFGQGLSILPPGTVDVDLTFFDTDQGIYAQGIYRADRLRPQTADALMMDLRSATEHFLRDPGSTLTHQLVVASLGQGSSSARVIHAGANGL